jgi:hypothetical protein
MIKTKIHTTALAIACLITLTSVASADTKVKLRQTSGGQTYENTSYIKGKRQRSEMNNGQMVVVQQCDLRRNIQIMPQAQAYIIQPYDTAANTSSTPDARANAQPGAATTKGGIVTSTVTTKDTGERKQMFGYTARHIITTMEMHSSPEACSQTNSKMQIDGWYIDAEFALDCDSGVAYKPYTPPSSGGCQDRYVTKQVGVAKKGYPVWEKMTMFDPTTGAESFSTVNEVVEFSNATLDASLFDVPAGYRQVDSFASVFSTAPPATENTTENKSVSSEPATATKPETKPEPKPEPKPKSDPVKKINKALRWP